MELIDSVRKHVKEIGGYQENYNFSREIDKFISENENLSDVELFEKLYSIYGTRIRFFENATRIKYLATIRGWLTFFGVIFVISLLLTIIYVFTILNGF